jgi:hypothetical protein
VYQAHDAPEKEWKSWFTAEDSEYSIEKRARSTLGIHGCWRRSSYWRDADGIRIMMTNRRKEIPMRYSAGADRETKEIPISEDDTPRAILLRLKAASNFYLADADGRPFDMEDWIFGYCSFAVNPPLQLLHGSASTTMCVY